MSDEGQEFVPGLTIVAEFAEHSARHGARVLLLDSPHHHAEMPSLADPVDVKFAVSSDGIGPEEKVIALPHPALLELTRKNGRKLSDPYCMRLAAAHLRHIIETSEDMEKTLVTVSPAELAAYDQQLNGVTTAANR